MNEIDQIQQWYQKQCDGDWEHGYGIEIKTLDNPGWSVEINLEGTAQENIPFTKIEYRLDTNDDDLDWYLCKVEDNQFKGVGGPFHLKTILETFLKWTKQ